MNALGKTIMFLSSYSPLYIFMISLNYDFNDIKISLYRIRVYTAIEKMDIIFYILILLIILSNLGLYMLIKFSKSGGESIMVKKIKNGNDKILDYILAYIVSFMTTDFAKMSSSDSKIITTFILIQLLLGYLYCKSNMLYINPVLNIIGYDIYLIETENNNVIVLTKNKKLFKQTKEEIARNKFKYLKTSNLAKGIYIAY